MFADRGTTGITENRPEFQRVLEFAREGKVDLIIIKSISRLGRNTALVLKTVRELKDIGVEVKFEKENIETMSGDGELNLNGMKVALEKCYRMKSTKEIHFFKRPIQ